MMFPERRTIRPGFEISEVNAMSRFKSNVLRPEFGRAKAGVEARSANAVLAIYQPRRAPGGWLSGLLAFLEAWRRQPTRSSWYC